jgi:hypothetical protein
MLFFTASSVYSQTVIRFNRLGYEPRDQKMVVVASKDPGFRLVKYRLVNAVTGVPVNIKMAGSSRDFGQYGPFIHSFRVNISTVATPGKYKLIVNDTIHSEKIIISHDVYHGSADATLAFLRDQRCGNETASLDSAHQTNDFIYGVGRGDSIQLNLAGGWHNVANEYQDLGVGSVITGYLLQAYREFPFVFNDNFDTWGKQGKNGRADVLDEGKWGLDWLLKMHPSKDRIYTALGNEHNPQHPPASNYNVAGRPVFLLKDSSGNEERIINTTSLLSTVLASGFTAFREDDPLYAKRLKERAENTYQWSARYAWKLGSKNDAYSGLAMASAAMSSISPDKKYQVSNGNFKNKSGFTDSIKAGGHFVIADDPGGCDNKKALLLKWKKIASSNAFHFSGGFNANSNYRLVLMSVEAMHYRQACGDTSFMELEQSCLDWLLGNNPWGVVMLAGLPVDGTVSKTYPPVSFHSVRRGLVNGPIADSIYKRSEGNSLLEKDNLENWQSSMAVYHDDAADYTTNAPANRGNGSHGLPPCIP